MNITFNLSSADEEKDFIEKAKETALSASMATDS